MEAATRNYSEDETRRRAFSVACGIWFTLTAGVLLIRVSGLGRRGSPRGSVSSNFCRLFALPRKSLLPIACPANALAAKQVARELQMRRLLRAKAWLQYGNLAVAIILGSVLSRTTQPGPRKNSAVQDVNLLVVSFVTLFVWAFPQSLTLRTLDVWSSLVMFCIALASSPLAMGGTHVNLLTWSATMLVCLFNMNIRLNLVWVCGVTMSSCSAVMFGVEDPLRTVACVPSRMDMISGELTVGIVFAMFIFLFHRSHSLGVWYEMEAHFSRNELKAARSVLRSVCDAVVELDSDFRLQDEATHLVNLLLLNPHRNLLGQDLRSFLATDEDRRKFSQQMSRTWLDSEDALDAGLSSAFHVSMRDSSSIPLDVEVISVRFMNREREVAYFVGIREFTDTCPMVRDTTPRAWPSDGRGGPQVLPLEDFGPLDIPAEDLSHSSEEPSSVNSEAFSWDREAPFEAAPAAWIDVLSPTFSVRHCTPGFSQCVDTGRAGELLPAVRRSHQSDFVDWMQEAYCSLVSEGSSGAPVQYDRWLHFRPPAPQRGAAGQARSARPRRVLSARLRLDLAPPPSPHHRGRGVVRILLEEARLGRAVPRASQEHLRAGTPPATPQAASGRLRGLEARAPRVAAGGSSGPEAGGGAGGSGPCPPGPADHAPVAPPPPPAGPRGPRPPGAPGARPRGALPGTALGRRRL